jgi:hypothetical protein
MLKMSADRMFYKERSENIRSRFHQHFTSSFYACRSQKHKNDSQVNSHFVLLWSTCLKALCKHVGEIDPWCKNSTFKIDERTYWKRVRKLVKYTTLLLLFRIVGYGGILTDGCGFESNSFIFLEHRTVLIFYPAWKNFLKSPWVILMEGSGFEFYPFTSGEIVFFYLTQHKKSCIC